MPAVAAAPARRTAAPATGWDSRLFVLRGDDRGNLRERAAALAAFADRHPDRFDALAATLLADLAPGGLRLAVVATSVADLTAKLHRAVGRLDAGAGSIREAGGVYFTDSPLAPQGQLALLFPGEGAQYPHMLADLCGPFPEVEETFAWCDRLAADAGRPSLRDLLHPPPGAAPADASKLGPAILGVLLADLAMGRLLDRLRLPVSAVAGHSAGEMAALLAAGAMHTEAVLGGKLADVMDLMDRQEDAAGGDPVTLLAVAAGAAAVRAVAPPAVVVAMDNCPHQCVAVGPAELVATVEAALTAKGVVCERLPVRRPYHTPGFEPWMGPFRALFDTIPFTAPHTPAYCCSTGEPFPADPDAVRLLAVNQWVRPVEFARMVGRMHADGVRLFVEAGPGGMLSGFVEDVLRGKPVLAVPSNLRRVSGPTQVNRLVGQLLVHQVPLDPTPLVADVAGRVEWEPRPAPAATDPVLADYLRGMEQFLDVQREVMAAFFAGAASPSAAAEPAQPWAFVGSVESLVPGESVVFRRPLDQREDHFAGDHTLGGREVSRVDPAQRGLPVLPMTVSLEAMAEAAALLAPGKVMVGIRDVRLRRWLPYDAAPTTLELRAVVATSDPLTGAVEVKADVRDLGNSFVPDGASKLAAEAIILLADRYPDPPEARPFALTDPKPCRSSIDDLRRNMFHGPLFRMIDGLTVHGPEGIEGTLTVGPRDGWLASNPAPRVMFDPILADAVMHLVGAWHLEQPDWTGRILLPFEVSRVEVFGPPPEPGTRLAVRGHTEESSARHFRHGLEAFAPDGRVWLRLTGAGYWRFYLPFGHVNFYGPKDEYFLSRELPDAAAPGGRCYALRPPADLMQPVLRMAGARVTLTPRELAEFDALPEAKRNDWLFTRLLAKDSARAAWADRHGERLFPADIETDAVGDRVVATPRGPAGPEPLPAVATATRAGLVVGFAAFARRVGVAIADTAAEAARLAAADAGGGSVAVRTTRDGELFVATAVAGGPGSGTAGA